MGSAPPPPSPQPIQIDSVTSEEGVLSVSIEVPAAGDVAVRGQITTRDGARTVCAARARAAAAGTRVVRCPLSRDARRRLGARWLRVSLKAIFTPATGATETVGRGITLPRE